MYVTNIYYYLFFWFSTYSKCVFNPSEYLNVIIGPNGTGKSTLVSAIVLSLGGEPPLLARSTSIGEYVKNGCETAEISVEIYDNNDLVDVKTTTFGRKFDINNKNTFYVNGQQMSKKNFLENVSKYNIQISNLCQFLPQDKVQVCKYNDCYTSIANYKILNFQELQK